MTNTDTHRPIVFFDGECNLCNSSVQFIIRHDSRKQFLFAPLQSARGAEAKHNIARSPGNNGKEIDSVVLFFNDRYYMKSTAALWIARLLGFPWSIFYAGMILPRFIRDAVYEFIARNRYKWFGKRNECMIPTPALKERFLS